MVRRRSLTPLILVRFQALLPECRQLVSHSVRDRDHVGSIPSAPTTRGSQSGDCTALTRQLSRVRSSGPVPMRA